jgi:hypothetical protein
MTYSNQELAQKVDRQFLISLSLGQMKVEAPIAPLNGEYHLKIGNDVFGYACEDRRCVDLFRLATQASEMEWAVAV